MDEELRKAALQLGMESKGGTEALMDSCLSHMMFKLSTNHATDIQKEELAQLLHEVLIKTLPSPKDGGPIPYAQFNALVDGLCWALAKITVGVCSMGPEALQDRIGMPQEQVLLLRRGMEDFFCDTVVRALKAHVTDAHVAYNEGYDDYHKDES